MALSSRASIQTFLASALVALWFAARAQGQAAGAEALYSGAPVQDFAPGLATGDFVKSLTGTPPAANPSGSGGQLRLLNANNFPAVMGQGVAIALINFNPCGQNILHTHPRATEISYVVSGKVLVGFVDTGANLTLHLNVMNPGDVTLFPQGLMHFQQEIGNAPAVLVSAFNNENPGVVPIPATTFQFPPEIIAVAFGQTSVNSVNAFFANLPANLAQGSLSPGGICQTIFSKNYAAPGPPAPAVPTSPGSGYRKLLSGEELPGEFTGPKEVLSLHFDPGMLISGGGDVLS
ncbi:cupin superfamily protein [Klebsormidium nitens]|uniref:Germin-like protein n=1 Tax=Klebsormidium nitens TaxID=105231 RepID=A0A1Y1HVT5_KLENI|nr:cupin superfamily protein [Klebsormidium nitens]|eukprot:GAQ81309.1 cupin superfamily protein [Klebsormidium nitens]